MAVGVDQHIVMVPAGTSMVPTPMPHPYIGKLKDKLSDDVEIGGKKAAVKGSKAKFESPGHFPMPPGTSFQNNPNNEAEVTNGCCDKVKINGKDACVLGSTATSCDDMKTPDGCNIVAMGASVVLPIKMPCIDELTFKQDGGFMINTRNMQAAPRQPGQEKHQKLSNPQWGASTAKVGEEVTLKVSSTDLHENANVIFTIWEEGFDPAVDVPVAKVYGPNKGNAAEAKWKWFFQPEDHPEPLTAKPKFVFTAIAFKCEEVSSSAVEIGMDLSLTVYHPDGSIASNKNYKAKSPGGQTHEGTTSSAGLIEIHGLIPGVIDLDIDGSDTFHTEQENQQST